MSEVPSPPPRPSRTTVATFVVVAVVVVAALVSAWALSTPCTGLSCGPPPEPVVQSATAQVDSFSPSSCQTTTDVAICRVFLGGGDHGVVSVNVSLVDQNAAQGSPQFEFLVYSSASGYVSFTSIPICAHTSAPSYEDKGCQFSGAQVETFRFSFAVAPTYGDATARWPDSISVVMWMNCCFA